MPLAAYPLTARLREYPLRSADPRRHTNVLGGLPAHPHHPYALGGIPGHGSSRFGGSGNTYAAKGMDKRGGSFAVARMPRPA